MQNRDLIWFIDRALQLLSRDVPQAYGGIQQVANGLLLAVKTEKTAGSVAVMCPKIEVFGPIDNCDVAAKVNETVIIDLIDGNITLNQALSQDHLVLTGSQNDLELLVSGLQLFLRGAVRSSAILALLDTFRDHTRG